MMTKPTANVRVVLYEGRGSEPLGGERRYDVASNLLGRGFAVTCTAGADDVTPGDSATLLVLGHFIGDPPAQADDHAARLTVHFRDIADLDGPGVVNLVESAVAELNLLVNQPGKWKPWFPVIDYDRCTNCMQCLSFCLFDVYGVDANHKIQVQNNDNCKTDCPACSRVCPEVAIMFPKYGGGPINGAPVAEADLKREAMKVDISALLGGDIYSRLRDRSAAAKERFARERDEQRALNERKRCLNKLAGQIEIPATALMDLPSRDEILRRAEEAKAKAEAARAANLAKMD